MLHSVLPHATDWLWSILFWPIARVVAKCDLVRLTLGRQAIKAARPEDLPAVMEALAKWKSAPRRKLR
jgi:hypothetical protein